MNGTSQRSAGATSVSDGAGSDTRISAYSDLRVWQQGMELAELCYRLTKSFPREETYGLISQIRRAAVSIPANIAEGYARESRAEYVRFCQIAIASLREVETLLHLSIRVEVAPEDACRPLLSLCNALGRNLWTLIRSLQNPKADCEDGTGRGRQGR